MNHYDITVHIRETISSVVRCSNQWRLLHVTSYESQIVFINHDASRRHYDQITRIEIRVRASRLISPAGWVSVKSEGKSNIVRLETVGTGDRILV